MVLPCGNFRRRWNCLPRRRVFFRKSGDTGASARRFAFAVLQEVKKMKPFRLRVLAQTLPFLLITPGLALAQNAPTRHQATAALNQPAKPGAEHYTRQQIDQMVAPIALYPDQLLSQVLMAATYPQQVVEAAQWLKEDGHAELQGDALVQGLEPLPWDPSIKALVAFPQIVEMMSEHIE